MKIGLINNSIVPVSKYGGTERIIWWLGKELNRQGHQTTLIAPKGSKWPYGDFQIYNPDAPICEQIPDNLDLVHFHFVVDGIAIKKPYMVTCHGNGSPGEEYDINTVFVSKNHAERHGSEAYVYNGIDLDDYGKYDGSIQKKHLLFLANAAWKIKNVKGAIRLASMSNYPLEVIGGRRLNLKMGFRFTLDRNTHFNGMLGGTEKLSVIREAAALIFPVLWHEPFGLAIIESMYFGCPVFATPWGSLPELVPSDMGLLSNSFKTLSNGIREINSFDRNKISNYICDEFNITAVANNYLNCYHQVLNGRSLNEKKPRVSLSSSPNEFRMID